MAVEAEKERVSMEVKAKEAKEEAERVAIEKAKLMAPDKEKILLFAQDIDNVVFPQVKTEEARAIMEDAGRLVYKIVEDLKKAANEL